MSQHPNARLTPLGRAELVARVGSGTPVAEAARQMGVSRQTASKWLSRPGAASRCRTARAGRPGSPGRPLRRTSGACWRPGAPCSWRRSPSRP